MTDLNSLRWSTTLMRLHTSSRPLTLLSMILCLFMMSLAWPGTSWAQQDAPGASPVSENQAQALTVFSELVDRAIEHAQLDAWDAQEGFRRGQAATLMTLNDPDASMRLAVFSIMSSVRDGEYASRRAHMITWPELKADVSVVPDEQPKSSEVQALKAQQAQLALDEALKREAAEQDLAQRALLKRKRELAEERVAWTDQAGDALLAERDSLTSLDASWTAFIEPLTISIEELSATLTQAQRVERVDPLMAQLISHRRELWQDTTKTRARLVDATEALVVRDEALAQVSQDLAALKAQPVRTSALRTQREEVNQAAVELAQDQATGARELVGVLRDRLEMQNQHIEEVSMLLRRVLPIASSEARSAFYDLFEAQNWRDALDLFRDRVDGWRVRLTQRWLTASTMSDRLTSVLLWVLALLPRLFLFVIASVVLRFIPALLRRMLDMLLRRALFRRNPGWAIKFYEISRVAFKPALFFWVASVIFDYILLTFPEALALWGAIEAVFVFWLVDRVARTLFFSRKRREESGYASSGEIDDLTPTEARMADVFLLEQELADRAVRSIRNVALLVIAWTWALDVLYAFVGYSVISFLIRWVLILAIFGVIFGLLSGWRTEIAILFARLLGDRAPNAKAFVDHHKDRAWGVAVISGAAIVVLIGEVYSFVRRHVLSTQAFRQANNFFFARKVELQSRLEERRFEPAVLSEAQLTCFASDAELDATTPRRLDRGHLGTLQSHHESWLARPRHGSVMCTAERGVGTSTLLHEFASSLETTVHSAPHIHTLADVMGLVSQLFGFEGTSKTLDELTQQVLAEPSRVIVLDDLEYMYIRTVGGYTGIRALCQLISDTDRVHFWVLGCNQQTWDFLQKVAELNQYLGHEIAIPRWSMAELRELLMARTEAAGLTITFQSLDANATGANVVKTEEGYFRYLEDFVRGNPAAALHYWCQSLCVEDHADADYSVQLFERRHAQVLTRLSDKHTFLLSALVHYSAASLDQLAEAMNLSQSACRTLLDRLDDLEIIVWQKGHLITIQRHWHPLVLRYLSDSNLLLS